MPSFFPTRPVIGLSQLKLITMKRLLKFDLNIHTRSDVELAQCINGLLSRLQDIEQSLMSADFELISGFFIDMRRAVHGEPFDSRRERNRTRHSPTGALYSLYNLSHRLIQHPMIVGFQPNPNFLIHLLSS